MAFCLSRLLHEPLHRKGAAQPLLRETREIRVNGKPVTVYVDEIEKQLTRGLYAHLGLQFGA